jgi:hypothetical protein
MNRKEAAQLVAVMAAAYPTAKVQDETAVAYHLLLSDVPYDAAVRAFTILGRTSKFMPTPAEIREVLADAVSDIEPWEAAWDELITTIKRHGSYLFRHRSHSDWPGWSDDLVAAAVNHVGYENVCGAEYEQLPTIRAQFRNFYQGEAARRKRVIQTGDAALPSGGGKIRAIKGEVAS